MGYEMKFGGFGNECTTCGVASCVCGESPVKACGSSGAHNMNLSRKGGITVPVGKIIKKKVKKVVRNIKSSISNIKENIRVNKKIKRRTKIKGGKTSHTHTSHANPRTLKSTDEKTYSRFGK